MNKIVKITKEGILYVNATDESCFIDFEICNENWINYRIRTEFKESNDFSKLKFQDKCVGQRDIIGKPPYIEFFVKPFIRFVFDSIEQFNETQREILKYGWATLDLS